MFLLIAALLTPIGLLGLTLLMEKVEQPLRNDPLMELPNFLETARPEEVEAFVSEGYAAALDRYWKRRGRAPR